MAEERDQSAGPDADLDPVLLSVLACPDAHHSPLELGPAPADRSDPALTALLTCTGCGRRFPVRDGIPVLLLDEALPPEADGAPAGPSR